MNKELMMSGGPYSVVTIKPRNYFYFGTYRLQLDGQDLFGDFMLPDKEVINLVNLLNGAWRVGYCSGVALKD